MLLARHGETADNTAAPPEPALAHGQIVRVAWPVPRIGPSSEG
jgi:hypothetical protein